MEYKKDKRTENLTLRDIHVGDWVQVWSEITERYSPPLKIIQICDDGTIYLVTSDEERPTPWEEDIKNVDALPITPELLRGFGFRIGTNKYGDTVVLYNGKEICRFYKDIWWFSIETSKEERYNYFHEFLDGTYFDFPELLNLEWKGVQSSATHPKGMSL